MFCSADLARGIHNQLISLSVINIFLSITAFLGNTLILVALRKETSLHPPSKLLLRSLATTDLCVGFTVEPLEVTFWMSLVNERWTFCRYVLVVDTVSSYILCSVSLLTLTAISVDRLFALLLGPRYKEIVTLRRSYITVTVIWVVTIFFSVAYVWNHLVSEWYSYIFISLCLITSIFSYTKIFVTLRHHQIQVHDQVPQGQPSQPSQAIPLNIARYRKAVYSTLWLQLALVVCYLPYSIARAMLTKRGLSSSGFIAKEFALTVLYFNSSLNPFLYCWKIKEVRQAVKDTIRQLFCSSS